MTAGDLDFDKVDRDEPAGHSGNASCAACHAPLRDTYFEVASRPICAACSSHIAAQGTQGSRLFRFGGALALGFLGALVGALIYFLVLHFTGYEIGLIAIAVGWLVGKGVFVGSQRRGGRLYQALAVVLTYLAIVSTYVPLVFRQLAAEEDFASLPLLVQLVGSFVIAFIAPVAAGFDNAIGILIIGIALWEAFALTRRVAIDISGPFKLAPAASPDDIVVPALPPLGGTPE